MLESEKGDRAAVALLELERVVRVELANGTTQSQFNAQPRAEALWLEILPALPSPRRPRRLAAAAKRSLDLVVGSSLLLLSVPVIAVLGVIVKLEDGGPMFFGHVRLTCGGRTFRCWKLRTMRVEPSDDQRFGAYAANDFKFPSSHPRITRIGRFMRGCYLDELPQFWNVVRGDMSLVGPRPVIAEEVRWWGPCADELLSVRPGIFGAWQLTDHMAYPHRAYLELAYVRSASLSVDLEILVKTCLMLVRRKPYSVDRFMPPQPAHGHVNGYPAKERRPAQS
jgi:lipopolysaccharide/colanic/teichoic acid biosynthesis glycosyltransferase